MSFWTKLREEATSPAVGADAPGAPPPTKRNEELRPMAMLKREELSSVPVASGDPDLMRAGAERCKRDPTSV